ncbi:MAG: ATP-binding cassette domain-containing protein [Betaproteobacteria bacterium]|nr:ATP-binding cassette domain-containing protein [Betaproteobacteria bacterium]
MSGSDTTSRAAASAGEQIVLRVVDLVRDYERSDGLRLQAVSGVNLVVRRGETLGLVGESGCGKSSLGRAILQLPPPTSGAVFFEGQDLTKLDRGTLRRCRRHLQMVFQDPISSLNPRRRVGEIVAEPLRIWDAAPSEEIRRRVCEVLEIVGFSPEEVWDRKPHEFSGGQCQRISLARAVVLTPALLICDEPVSALDASVQAQILNLLQEMKTRYRLTMMFISHDLAVVKNVSDRVAVMYLGKIVETGPTELIYRRPRHHYTRALMDSILTVQSKLPEQEALAGELPSALDPPGGCRFRTRCPRCEAKCAQLEPPLADIEQGHAVACHFPIP